ncbi:MAG: cyclic nucleotide-binding domain-containing protein [Rhizobiaceae bacterium]|nr:cyclic nucleotide-binding domain-containing protein [Rhizobiaceae bacterium]
MSNMISPAVLIHLGALLYIVGFLVRDELLLRLLVLGGTALYILYYFLFPDEPLWDAIITSLILAAANLWVLFKIMYERTTFALSDEELKLYQAFETLNPGQFRKVLRSAIWHSASGDELMCIENERAEHIYYLIEGEATVEKGEKNFSIGASSFVGEIAYVLNGNYTATVKAKPGLRYVEWRSDNLRKLSNKNPALHNALIALFNRDLAAKLAISHQ